MSARKGAHNVGPRKKRAGAPPTEDAPGQTFLGGAPGDNRPYASPEAHLDPAILTRHKGGVSFLTPNALAVFRAILAIIMEECLSEFAKGDPDNPDPAYAGRRRKATDYCELVKKLARRAGSGWGTNALYVNAARHVALFGQPLAAHYSYYDAGTE